MRKIVFARPSTRKLVLGKNHDLVLIAEAAEATKLTSEIDDVTYKLYTSMSLNVLPKVFGTSEASLHDRALGVAFGGPDLHSTGICEKYKAALCQLRDCFKTSANSGMQLKAYSKAMFHSKSRCRKAGSYHRQTFTTCAFFETSIALDEWCCLVLKSVLSIQYFILCLELNC